MTSLRYVHENPIVAWTNLLMDPWISPPSSTIDALPLFLTTFLSHLLSGSESSVPSRGLELLTVNSHARRWTRNNLGSPRRRQVTIDMLPDVALLQIFDFYLYEALVINAWHTLVHMCQKWRNVVLGSPCKLGLRLVCSARKSWKKTLAIWPALPLDIVELHCSTQDMDNIFAALEHNSRVYRVQLWMITSSQLENVWAATKVPFPELEYLTLAYYDKGETAPVVPDSFLGGSAPRLRGLSLIGISFPFPLLRKLLLSATHLTKLYLWDIPQSAYMSPRVMVTCLSTLTSLESLHLRFELPRPLPVQESRRPPTLARTLLPALSWLEFRGISEYLEDLLAQIDAPLLDCLEITFFHQLIFDTPQLTQFISRTPKLKIPLRLPDAARIVFYESAVYVVLLPRELREYDRGVLMLKISCRELDWQLSSLAQICSSSLPLIPSLEQLYIHESEYSPLGSQDDIENGQWLECFRPFTAVKYLYVCREFVPQIASALERLVGERAMDVLPSLRNLFLELRPSGAVEEAINQFVAARQPSGHPIVVSHRERSYDQL